MRRMMIGRIGIAGGAHIDIIAIIERGVAIALTGKIIIPIHAVTIATSIPAGMNAADILVKMNPR